MYSLDSLRYNHLSAKAKGILSMNITNKHVVILTLPFVALILVSEHSFIWKNIDKIGSLATAAALFAAMYQSYVAWIAARSTSEANAQNFFQQKFNLILEQHNNSLALVTHWLKNNPLDIKITTHAVCYIRGHENLSPYMRILYHTLKTIRTEFPSSSNDKQYDSISLQKKYSSLVRSFIPNDVLYTIAINSSLFDEKKTSIPNSSQYEYYYKMLVDYDFFEHLIIKSENKLHLKKEIHEICIYTYDACFAFYAKQANIVHNDRIHIEKLDGLLNDINFHICLTYNLHDKYIVTPEYISKKIKISELALKFFINYESSLSPHELMKFLVSKTNDLITTTTREIIRNHNYFYHNQISSTYGLFNENCICDYFSKNLKFNNKTADIIIFRDNFHQNLKKLIEDTSSYYKNTNAYRSNISNAANMISNEIENLIGKIITMRQLIDYYNIPEEILDCKRKELMRRVKDKIDANHIY